jgi:flagellar motility protein MotE (MotC chaperone)
LEEGALVARFKKGGKKSKKAAGHKLPNVGQETALTITMKLKSSVFGKRE